MPARAERLGGPGWVLPLVVPLLLGACPGQTLEERKAEELASQQARGEGDLPFRPLTEAEKIERLLFAIRDSGFEVVKGRRSFRGEDAELHFRRRLRRMGRRVRTAEHFVYRTANAGEVGRARYMIRTDDGEVFLKDWLAVQLREIERPPEPVVDVLPGTAPIPAPSDSADADAPVGPAQSIEELIERVEHSGRPFWVPNKDGGETRYSAGEFASLLERKSFWLGEDIESIEDWLGAIASSTFLGRAPYRVELDGGQRVPVVRWLEALAAGEAYDAPDADADNETETETEP